MPGRAREAGLSRRNSSSVTRVRCSGRSSIASRSRAASTARTGRERRRPVGLASAASAWPADRGAVDEVSGESHGLLIQETGGARGLPPPAPPAPPPRPPFFPPPPAGPG